MYGHKSYQYTNIITLGYSNTGGDGVAVSGWQGEEVAKSALSEGFEQGCLPLGKPLSRIAKAIEVVEEPAVRGLCPNYPVMINAVRGRNEFDVLGIHGGHCEILAVSYFKLFEILACYGARCSQRRAPQRLGMVVVFFVKTSHFESIEHYSRCNRNL